MIDRALGVDHVEAARRNAAAWIRIGIRIPRSGDPPPRAGQLRPGSAGKMPNRTVGIAPARDGVERAVGGYGEIAGTAGDSSPQSGSADISVKAATGIQSVERPVGRDAQARG